MNLVPARIELHYAAQILSACADAWLPVQPDDSHTAMIWRAPEMHGETELALRCVDFAIIHGEATFRLAGTTLADALAWADAQLGAPRNAKLRDYDLPPSMLRSGGRFVGYEPELAELASWYTAAADAVTRFAEGAAVRIWPHHFDLGAVLTDKIGIGLSPGDRYYAEPYFYVQPATPLARPPKIDGGGAWRTDAWQGAVLLTSAGGDPDAFFRSAIESARRSQ